MSRRYIACNKADRGGQHVGAYPGIIVIDDDTGIGVFVDSERSQMACRKRADELLDLLLEEVTNGTSSS